MCLLNSTITSVKGLEAGHYTDLENATGCTVVLCRQGAVGGVDVRGGSPGTRETDLLRPVHRVDRVHAILLSGGSAFGLDAAGGVVRYLEEKGIGFEAGPAVVPIVSGAILFDLALLNHKVRPGPEEGYRACLAAVPGPMAEGCVGAGTGATVAKGRGRERAIKSGIGSASLKMPNGSTVSAAVAVNAYGGIFDHRSGRLVAGPRRDDGQGFDDPVGLLMGQDPGKDGQELSNTTIGVVATDARLTREEANYLARVSHDGLALSIRPCHTIRDGDTMFALATGHLTDESQPVDLTVLGAAGVEVTALAILRAVETATGLGGLPATSELPW
ncbi:MAG: hypothetical protein BZY80_02235 [SAR202 cluster bacterium Io17-Chloro-G2]|nr:MAG: hypothetical protein BZY80_02235 [SAR202 cluster bacterium Io17-Chloro-G2]